MGRDIEQTVALISGGSQITHTRAMLSFLLLDNMSDRLLFSLVGVGLSAYALHVERRKEANPTYRAMCDFSEHLSCSRALCSPYGKGFGIVGILLGPEHVLNQRNCSLGIVFYLLQVVLALLPNQNLASSILFCTSVVAGIGSAYLAFILFFVLKDICVVCIFTYVVNASLIYLNYGLYQEHLIN